MVYDSPGVREALGAAELEVTALEHDSLDAPLPVYRWKVPVD